MIKMPRTGPGSVENSATSFCRFKAIKRIFLVIGLSAFSLPYAAHAYIITITPGDRSLYLQVGTGGYRGTELNGGEPNSNSRVNRISLNLAADNVGSGIAQVMASDSRVNRSPIDGFRFCNRNAQQVYIGAWFRPGGGGGQATLTVEPNGPTLDQVGGSNTIPFSQISWTVSGIGDSTFQFPPGSFDGPTVLATFQPNTWKEQCLTFSYANTVIPAAGAYSGSVTYTLALP